MTYGCDGGSCASVAMTVTSGNLLVAGCGEGSGNEACEASDTLGNTFTAIGAKGAGTSTSLKLWYAKITTGGADTIKCKDQVNWPGGVDGIVHEYSGLHATSPFDTWSGSGPVANLPFPATTLSITTAEANELVVSFLRNGVVMTLTGQSGTARVQQTANYVQISQDANVASAGSYTSTFDGTGNWFWVTAQAAFKQAGGGGADAGRRRFCWRND